LTFIEPNNNTFSGTGTTNLNTLIINKGTSYASVLEMNLPNFTVKGLSSAAVGFLTLTKGMLKVSGTNTFNGAVFTTAAYSIGATVGFWLNNLNFTVNGQNGSPTVAGMLRITQGIYNIGTATGNSMGFSAGSNIIIEGGTVNATGRFGVAAAANTFTYTQSGGTITVCTIGNASTTLYNFDLGTSISSTINWTGGTVVVQKAASGTTHPGYRNDAGGNIAGGTLQIGNAASGAAGIFNIYSTVPNLVIDPTYAHSVIFTLNTSTGQFYDNCQNITIGAGTSLNIGPNLFLFEGTTFTNNGTLIATGASTRLYFSNTVAQTYTGTGVATAPVTSLDFDNDVSVTFSQTNNMACARIDLFAGNVFGSNKLTLGNASAVSNSVQIGGTTTPLSPGSFDAPFTFNLGTLGEIVYYLRSDASRTTGGEINPSRVLTALTYDDNDPAHTLTLAGGNLSAGTLYVTNGLINTSASNLLTVTGGTTTSIVGGSSTAYVNGPLAVTLPASLVTGSTYAFPVGKSAYKPLELVNPITNAGGTVVVKSEVFDSNCGGITGAGIGTLNTNRYWNSAITSGAGNFTGTAVRLTEDGLAANNIMAQSGTVNGTYNLISSLPPASTTIISDNITSLGYFVVGTSIAVVTGTLNGTVTDASSNPISGATVSFGSNTTTTAANGTYEFLNVFHGTYTVTCSKTGYITSTVPGVVINSSSTTTQNFTLSFQLDPPVNLQGSVQNNNDAHLTWNVPGSATLQDGFESYNDFAINFPPWINTDVDGSLTYGITDVDWLNSGSAQSFIVYNSLTTTPPFASNIAHSGDKFAACFAASTPANNDWLISPQVVVVTGSVLKFWARSYVDTYGLERFKVGISTTGTATTDFTIISAGTYVEAPLAWTEYTYDLSAYVGQNIHVAINCVSSDAFILMVDDFSVGVSGKSLSGIDNPTVNPALEQLTNAGNSITRFKDGSISNAQMNNNEMSRSNSKLINHAQSVNTDIPAVNIQDLDSHAALVMNNSHAPARSPWTLSGYNIYREGIKINASLVTNQFYNDLGLAPGTYHFGVKAVYPQGESAAVNTTIVITAPLSKTLNLTSVFLEGLYAGNGTMSTAALHVPPFGAGVADLITVELHAAADYSLVTSYEVELSTTGTATVTVGAAYGASYYITVKHRNSIETTTAVPVSFAGATIDQAFTLGNVYGGNLGLMSGPGTYYAIYAGDVDQNGTVDSGDFTPVDNDASLYLSGYLATDVNGDGGIDTGDFTAVDNNGLNYISTAHP